MSTIGTRDPQVFVRHPEHARIVAEMLADTAAASRRFPHRKAYQALRSLSPDELFEMSEAARAGRDEFVAAFGPLYHRELGDDSAGPLFADEGGAS